MSGESKEGGQETETKKWVKITGMNQERKKYYVALNRVNFKIKGTERWSNIEETTMVCTKDPSGGARKYLEVEWERQKWWITTHDLRGVEDGDYEVNITK